MYWIGTQAIPIVSDFHIPLWGLFVATLPLAYMSVRVWLRPTLETQRKQLGLCPSCGYDMRASPARCPECGKVPDPSAAPRAA